MDIPYGFDCYTFQRDEIKFFESNMYGVKRSIEPKSQVAAAAGSSATDKMAPPAAGQSSESMADFIKFTRKNEDYPMEQIRALGRAGRLNMSEIDKRLFCGIKIQIGIGLATNFLRQGLQYKAPIRGRSELINGTWTGVMKGLTSDKAANFSYDLALGNFLAWDEEHPYINFGPFFAVESKLVLLTGGSKSIETSSFGTNMRREIWLTITALLLILSLLASLKVYSASQIEQLERSISSGAKQSAAAAIECRQQPGYLSMFQDFLFIYITMLLNKPSVEFDDLVWPKKHHVAAATGRLEHAAQAGPHPGGRRSGERGARRRALPSSIRTLSYLWSAACLVIASIYSGEMLAVMLLHADQNIDTIAQLINSRTRIEPVIRQDDMTYQLMLKSLDENMLRLHNITRIIPRAEVYTRSFIESVSGRKVALLGDDELIDTIYDLYHKYYPLYKSKMTYLQYPISFVYRKDLNKTIEAKLRGGMVQMFEMGLIHRWYQAQKDTYIQFYDTYERNKTTTSESKSSSGPNKSDQSYKPLSMHQFGSFFSAVLLCKLVALVILICEMIHHRLNRSNRPSRVTLE